MASPFLHRPLTILTSLSLGLGFSTLLLASPNPLRPRLQLAYCDSPSPSRPSIISENIHSYTRDTQVPIFLNNGRPNPAAYRQISAGSITGLVGGVAVSYFSRTLAIVFGLAVFGVQYLVNRGINIIPAARLQQYVKGIDLRSAVEDNAAFKLSFGITFALASLAGF